LEKVLGQILGDLIDKRQKLWGPAVPLDVMMGAGKTILN
jgi:hypothetical protein